jgi:hypothetical protein
MKRKSSIARAVAFAIGLGVGGVVNASVPIQFDMDGPGTSYNAQTVLTFDWSPGNTLLVEGIPPTGPVVGQKLTILYHARLSILVVNSQGEQAALPAGTEFTAVLGVPMEVTGVAGSQVVMKFYGGGSKNFFEIWTGAPDSSDLAGTGFNNGFRIMRGQVTDASAFYFAFTPTVVFDQFGLTNDYPGQMTVQTVGSAQTSIQITHADADYFPGFSSAQLAGLKAFLNTSAVLPFYQVQPSNLFVDGDAGADGTSAPAPSEVPDRGLVNGQAQAGMTLDFQLQADANQSFEPGTDVPGACRVTYGGNDRNGNADPRKFGEACSRDGKKDENCYTFGGQVGAPTANPDLGGPFGEHTHHQKSGPAGSFVFHAGTHSAPKPSRITATSCWDPGACRPAEANAGFKQIDFEGTGTFRTLDDTARAYLMSNTDKNGDAKGAAVDPRPDNQNSQLYYFRVDMDDLGEPGNKWSPKKPDVNACKSFFSADLNRPLNVADPIFKDYVESCSSCPDVYQFYICPTEAPCEQSQAMYRVRGFLTGGNIQIHKVIK